MNRTPIYVQIQSFLRLGIENGKFREGDRLPSEQHLAEQFGTTRSTVAKALQQLVFEGLIDRRVGSGSFVCPSRIEDSVDTNLLESFEDHMLAAGELLNYALIAFERTAPTLEIKKALRLQNQACYRLERLRCLGRRKVALEIRHLPESIARGINPEWLTVSSVQDVLREGLGLQIGHMENAISATVAKLPLAQTIGVAEGAALLVREHTIFDTKGRALLYGKTYYTDNFSVRYNLGSPRSNRRSP